MGGIISGIGSLIGGSQASSYDKAASNQAQQVYGYTSSNLSPYISTGTGVLGDLSAVATSGPTGGGPDYVSQAAANTPYSVLTQSGLEQTPGYQFIRDQGLKSTLSQNAARGLGVSGAALKGAASYVTGLASNTYQNQFSDAQQQFSDYLNLNTAQQSNLQNQFSRLYNTANLGETAASDLGRVGASLTNTSANALTAAGNATAQGTKGFATGIGNALNDTLGYVLNPTGGTGGYDPNSGYVDTGRWTT